MLKFLTLVLFVVVFISNFSYTNEKKSDTEKKENSSSDIASLKEQYHELKKKLSEVLNETYRAKRDYTKSNGKSDEKLIELNKKKADIENEIQEHLKSVSPEYAAKMQEMDEIKKQLKQLYDQIRKNK